METRFHIIIVLLVGMTLALVACGGDSSTEEEDLPTLTATCLVESDCDDDGLYTSCDDDDTDSANTSIKDGCDEDLDGFVDTYCTAYDNQRDVNDDGLITADERDVNCDTCPPGDPTQSYNPDQTDTDLDGIGDDCSVAANINIGAAVPDSEAATSDAPATDTADTSDTEETFDITVSATSNDETAKLGRSWTVNFDVTNNSEIETIFAEVLLKKGSGIGTGMIKATALAVSTENLTVAPFIFCGDTNTSCVTLGPDEITATAAATTSFSLDFTMPSDIDEGKYTGQIRLIVTADDGSEQVIARDSLSSKVEVSAGTIPGVTTFPGVAINPGINLSTESKFTPSNAPSPGFKP